MTHETAVDPQTGELVPIPQGNGLTLYREPKEVLSEARKAAIALKEVISQKKNPVIFNKEQYLEFEDWQTCARFYGLTVKVVSTAPVQFGNVLGFEARASVIDANGREVSSADAMCLNDEDKWSMRTKYEWRDRLDAEGKKIWDSERKKYQADRVKVGEEAVPLFQLRSMAQTRACAKALRNVLSWVVVLAGYKPNVAEELDEDTFQERPKAPEKTPPAQPQRASSSQGGDAVISEPQGKRFYAIAKGAGFSDDQLKDALLREFNYEHSKDIRRGDYEKVCAWFEKQGEPGRAG